MATINKTRAEVIARGFIGDDPSIDAAESVQELAMQKYNDLVVCAKYPPLEGDTAELKMLCSKQFGWEAAGLK